LLKGERQSQKGGGVGEARRSRVNKNTINKKRERKQQRRLFVPSSKGFQGIGGLVKRGREIQGSTVRAPKRWTVTGHFQETGGGGSICVG